MVPVPWLEAITIVGSKILRTTAYHHLCIPFAFLVLFVTHVQVVCLLALIVSIADQDELAMVLHFTDLRLCELGHS